VNIGAQRLATQRSFAQEMSRRLSPVPMATPGLRAIVMTRPIRHHGRQTERDITMTSTGQAITRRPSRISVPRVVTAIVFAGGIGLGLVAGRSLSGAAPAPGTGTFSGAGQQTAQVAGLATYRATQASLAAALARGDAASAAHFLAELATLRTPAIVSALAHERVDLELGLASATAWHDPRMTAEFRSRLAAQGR